WHGVPPCLAAEVLERGVVDQTFPVGLVLQVRVPVPADLDETNHLVVAEALDGIVDTPLVEPQPVVMRLRVRPHPAAVPVAAHACPTLATRPAPPSSVRSSPGPLLQDRRRTDGCERDRR